LTEVKLPARITSPVRSAKKRSTRLSQDDEVATGCGFRWELEGLL
jgi:hypothetical protein